MDQEFAAALDPVLRDLRATCAVPPLVREERDDVIGELVVLYEPDGSGAGLVARFGGSAAERTADLADQAQDWAVEALCAALRPAVWPECPEHPGSHPLEAGVVAGAAVWSCPRTRRVAASIGQLGGPVSS
ncbi:hypothetical protein DMA15_08835 [Streptomyces sp. WAC 01529]|uniref:hypothetical protein n=1 Tax=Streptomyces sp. WAC 01529 TaxID=2203205 RepID=UPI000F6EF497|nr:hypothetical protein [Streptomyces sp. WAC 01529]AZM52689.1 hypothetical protein DMA15_08835 [Streptomyces sp. WAC 01529]